MILGACDADGQTVQLFDRFRSGGFGEKFLALQHGAIVFDDVFDQARDICSGLIRDVSLGINFTQFQFQYIVDGVGGRLLVIDLTAGA